MSVWERYGCEILSFILLLLVLIVLAYLGLHYLVPALGLGEALI